MAREASLMTSTRATPSLVHRTAAPMPLRLLDFVHTRMRDLQSLPVSLALDRQHFGLDYRWSTSRIPALNNSLELNS